jgi:hypothetical protein
MSPIDERLKSLNIVLPDVMPPVVDGYVPAFAPFTRSGDQIHLSGRLGKEGSKLPCGKVGEEISSSDAEADGEWSEEGVLGAVTTPCMLSGSQSGQLRTKR